MNYTNFNKVTDLPIGLGIGKIEYEELVCYMLNKYIELQLEFSIPLTLQYKHDNMVHEGWLIDHKDNKYTLSQKSIGILYGKYGILTVEQPNDTTFDVITWSDDIQHYMEIDGFRENSCLINDEPLLSEYGSSAYFIRRSWLETLSN